MKYSMMIRSRPHPGESIEEKHNSFVSCLGTEAWGFQRREYPPAPDASHHLSAIVQLRNYLKKGMKGRLSYSFRTAGRDEAMYDDYCMIEFSPTAADYSSLVTRGFQAYVECFSAYRGEILDVGCYELDFEKARGIDARQGLVRIAPVCFVDKELCLRGFQLTPDAVANRLATAVEQVRLVHDGVLIIATSRIVSIDESNSIDHKLRSLLA
jgi:hypothetical protein